MALDLQGWLLVFLVPLFGGSVILRALGLRFRDDRLAYPAWAWMAGATAFTLFLFAWLTIGLPPQRLPIAGSWMALASVALVIVRRLQGSIPPANDDASTKTSRPVEALLFHIVVAFCVVLTAQRAIESNSRPIIAGDELHIWAVKAKAVFVSGAFNDELARRTVPGVRGFHPDYPLLNPLLQTWTFMQAGRLLDFENRLPIQAFMIALVLALGSALRRWVRPSIAAALLFLVIGCHRSVFLSYFAYSDHIVALGFVVALDAWWRFATTRRAGWLGLASGAVTMALWAKNEAMLLSLAAGAGFAASLVVRRSWKRPARGLFRRAAWLLLPLGVVVVHAWHKAAFGYQNDLTGGWGGEPIWVLMFRQFGDRIGIVSKAFASMMLWRPLDPFPWSAERSWFFLRTVDHNGLIAAALLLAAFYPRRLVSGALLAPFLFLVFSLVGFFMVYLGSFQEIVWHLGTSLDRVLYDIVPCAALWLAAAGGRLFGDDRLATASRVPEVP